MSSSEAYQGDLIKRCQQFNFGDANAVVVSGSSWNPCGHMLLNTGGPNGYYFHIAEVKGRPRYMDHDGYKRYLEENDKRELSRTRSIFPNHRSATASLKNC